MAIVNPRVAWYNGIPYIGSQQSVEWNGGMEQWNGTVEWVIEFIYNSINKLKIKLQIVDPQ